MSGEDDLRRQTAANRRGPSPGVPRVTPGSLGEAFAAGRTPADLGAAASGPGSLGPEGFSF